MASKLNGSASTIQITGPQVIAAGLWRCATVSLKTAFEQVLQPPLTPSMHGGVAMSSMASMKILCNAMAEQDKQKRQEMLHTVFDGFHASSDWPGHAFVDDLMDMYPDAKVILNKRRTPEEWSRSARTTLGYYQTKQYFWLTCLVPHSYWHHQLYANYIPLAKRRYGVDDIFSIECYERHNEWVRRAAAARGKEILEWQPDDGWEPLCAFLGYKVPDEPFPRTNDTAHLIKLKPKFIKRGLWAWFRVLSGTALVIGGINAIGYTEVEEDGDNDGRPLRIEADRPFIRAETINAVTEYYNFLTLLPYVQLGDILYPPRGGWPNITQEKLAALGKNDEVIQLLAHLPYIGVIGPFSHSCMVAPWTSLLDYRGDAFQRAIAKGAEAAQIYPNFIPPFENFPEWVMPLTSGSRCRDYLLLDTTDGATSVEAIDPTNLAITDSPAGTITCYVPEASYFDPYYSSDDPRSWRDICDGTTKPVTEYIQDMKRILEQLSAIPYFDSGKYFVSNPKEDLGIAEELRAIYRKHGWPHELQRDRCREALILWDEQRGAYEDNKEV